MAGIDASVYDQLGRQPQGINQPFANLQQVMNLRQQQQVNQALEQERQSRAAETNAQTQKLQQQQQDQQAVDTAIAQGGSHEDILGRLAQTQHGHLIPQMQEQFSKAAELDQKAKDAKLATEKAENDYAAHLASSVLSYKDYGQPAMLNAFQAAAQVAQAHGHDVSQVVQAVQQDPTSLEQRMKAVIAMAQGPEPVKETVVPADASLVRTGGMSPASGQVIASGGQKPADRYQAIQAQLNQKLPVNPADLAWAQAYEKDKTLGPEATAAAAANRQAATIAQQNDLQAKAQAFNVSETGKKELDKVDSAYSDAQEKASSLRSALQIAKNGNMVAGSVAPLLGVLGIVTSEGVKRINTTELNQVQGAGSLLERIRGQAGSLADGQPMSPKLQKDLQQLSDMLEQSAAQKHSTDTARIVTRYPGSGAAPTSPVTPAPGAPVKESPEHIAWRLTGKQGVEPK